MRKVDINAVSIFCAIEELGKLRLISKELQQKLIKAAIRYRESNKGRKRFDYIDLQSTIRVTTLAYSSAISRQNPYKIEMQAISKCPDAGVLAEIFFEEKPESEDWKISIRSCSQWND
ncbi:MAG: hypothetical protein WC460_00480 [Patescibacteria group bacterium]